MIIVSNLASIISTTKCLPSYSGGWGVGGKQAKDWNVLSLWTQTLHGEEEALSRKRGCCGRYDLSVKM